MYMTISLLILGVAIIYILYLIIKRRKISIKYNQTLSKMSKYEKIINEQGKKNHEYNNQLMILKGYIDNKEKLNEYLSSIIDDCKTGEHYEIRQLSNLSNNGLKELLYFKLSKMKKSKIKSYLYVSPEFDHEFEKYDISMIRDITKIFGVFIDNAIDGAIESKDKEVDLDFKVDGKYLLITISNSFNNKNKKNIGKKGFTTKGVGRGFGLSLVKDIVRRNRYIDTVRDIENNKFIQTIIIETK